MSSSNKKTARLAGSLYLLVILFGVLLNSLYARKFIMSQDAGATASNIKGNEWFLRCRENLYFACGC